MIIEKLLELNSLLLSFPNVTVRSKGIVLDVWTSSSKDMRCVVYSTILSNNMKIHLSGDEDDDIHIYLSNDRSNYYRLRLFIKIRDKDKIVYQKNTLSNQVDVFENLPESQQKLWIEVINLIYDNLLKDKLLYC